MDDVNKWIEIYRKLDEVSPEVFDCGKLCGSACCVGYNSVSYPESLFKEIDWESPDFDLENNHSPSFSSIPRSELSGIIWGDNDNFYKSKQLGIYLLPGEHQIIELMDDRSWLDIELQDPKACKMPASWEYPVYFVNCKEPPKCPRQWRPLQCRTFPLKPAFDDNGVLELIWEDESLPYSCPLIDYNAPIHDDFYRVTYEVWSELVQDSRIFDFVMQGC